MYQLALPDVVACDDDVLSDTVKALGRRVRVSHDYDIPYIAGYSARLPH
jgi:hypothetical protein